MRSRTRQDVRGAGRILWLDCAKGLGIILVVIGHAAGGLIDTKGVDAAPWLLRLFFAIYTFHMPLFFFLSALLISRRLERSRRSFARSLASRIVWPYFFWSVIQLTIIYLAGALVNSPIDSVWPAIIALPWATVSQFWFLYALATLQLLTLLLLPMMSRIAFLGVMVVLWVLPPLSFLPGGVEQARHYAICFGMGIAIGTNVGNLVGRMTVSAALLLLLAVGVALSIVARLEFVPLVATARPHAAALAASAWQIDALPAAVLGSILALFVACRVRGAPAAVLAYLGVNSMAIYLVHVICVAGARIVIGRVAGAIDPAILLALLTAVGLAGPIAVGQVARRLEVARFLGLD